jgi:hypothetical protein
LAGFRSGAGGSAPGSECWSVVEVPEVDAELEAVSLTASVEGGFFAAEDSFVVSEPVEVEVDAESDGEPEPSVSAAAVPALLATATPMPSATASAPTRPMNAPHAGDGLHTSSRGIDIDAHLLYPGSTPESVYNSVRPGPGAGWPYRCIHGDVTC